MRVSKSAEERKEEILNVAEILFITKGYDGTSTNNILEEVGIARGTLYHHFKSKEDIMDGLIDRYSTQLTNAAKEITGKKELSVEERFIYVLSALHVTDDASGKQIKEHVHQPQNALMHQKMQKVMIDKVAPILSELLFEGIENGSYETPYPRESMEMLVTYAAVVFDDEMVCLTRKEHLSRVEAFIFNAERMLGAKRGSLSSLAATLTREENMDEERK